ncbi:SDR family oxidoreductase [Pseudomonas sp. dw_358]|uniref:SDR family NAD(P)-dependent oxidoreductase n=1 Tax=Pseudomonas sp. dw_358 TaxID=2720083 RepID=UPI001BD5012F|nr:SDR family oxidoreductase [Pseudomonas sp. dw_358]
MQSLKGKWALVTGASSGMGREYAHALAERGAHLVLVARRIEPMAVLAREIEARHGVVAKVQSVDLSVAGAAARLKDELMGQGVEVDVLINNAGMGVIGDFLEQTPASLATMLNLNVLGLTELTQVFAASMKARGGGHIQLLASVAAFQPCPMFAAYAASKAYVLSFGEALHTELAPYGVVVSVLSPGVTDTEFFTAAGSAPNAAMKRMMMAPRPVVDVGLAALFQARSSVVAGALNRLMVFSSRFLSRQFLSRVSFKVARSL